jgi:large subunit ribosomal protein L30
MINSYKEYEGKTLEIKQIKGDGGYEKSQRGTIVGLGLKGVNTSIKIKATKEVIGMLDKVKHLIKMVDVI